MATRRLWSVLSSGPKHARVSCYRQHTSTHPIPFGTLSLPLDHASAPCARAWGPLDQSEPVWESRSTAQAAGLNKRLEFLSGRVQGRGESIIFPRNSWSRKSARRASHTMCAATSPKMSDDCHTPLSHHLYQLGQPNNQPHMS